MSSPAALKRSYVQISSGQVHLRRAGRDGAPPLVLLHQTPITSAMYEPLMQRLSIHFHVIAPDTPGFGASDAVSDPFAIESAAAALCEAVGMLIDGPCHWFGHHTGAALALQIATTAPQRVSRLAMSGPCLLDDALRTALPQRAALIPCEPDGGHLNALWQRMRAKDPAADPGIWERDTLAAVAAGHAYPQAYHAVTRVDSETQLAALSCPTLVFAGTDDPLYPQLDAAYRLLRNGRKAEIADARSYVCERAPDAVARLLIDFLDMTDG